MFSALNRSLKIVLLVALAVAFAMFSIVNREPIALRVPLLPYEVEMPLFLLVILCISLGAFIGWCVLSLRLSRAKRQFKSEHKRVVSLEQEISVLHAEQRDREHRLPANIAS